MNQRKVAYRLDSMGMCGCSLQNKDLLLLLLLLLLCWFKDRAVAATDNNCDGLTRYFLSSASKCKSEREYKNSMKNKEKDGFRHWQENVKTA